MTLRKAIFGIVIFIIGFSSCNPDKNGAVPNKDDFLVEPLREHYDVLIEEARLWRNDAFLESIWFEFEARGKLVRAHFQAPTEDYESFGITLDPMNDTISTEIFNYKTPIDDKNPINETDWKFDSDEAMNFFFSYDEIVGIWEPSSQRCNDLKLRHFFVNEQWVLAWILTISDCSSYVEYFYLDPITGEQLDLEY
jgi:hypothetical protein